MSYPGAFYPGQLYPNQTDPVSSDTASFTESVSIVVFLNTSDAATATETRLGATANMSSDVSTFVENTSRVASLVSSDSSTFTEISNLNTADQALGMDNATFTDVASLVVQINTSDTASQSESTGGQTSRPVFDTAVESETSRINLGASDLGSAAETSRIGHNRSDISSLSEQNQIGLNQTDTASLSETKDMSLIVSDTSNFTETRQPSFNYIWTADSFNLVETRFGNFQYQQTDIFEFDDQAVVFEKTIITEDPFTYPESYFGSERVRVIAQDHFTREFLHWDLPVDNIQLTFSLSGPNLFSGVISTEMESLLNLSIPLTPDRTWLHVEQGNTIIASFILTPFVDNPQDQTRQIEGEGFAVYPNWVYYEGDQYIRIQTDPADIIRYIWDHVQSYPDGNLGVKVWPTVTPIRIGYPNVSVTFTTKEMNEVSITGEPYNLNFWSVINCGEEINRLCQETPIEYWEYSQWNDFKTDVEHYIVLGYPRVGRKRTDLTFREGENLVQLIPSYQETQENYASDVFVIGAGEGPGAVRAKASGRIGRLRKTNVIQDQTISNKARAQSIADFEFKRIAKSRFLIENILVDTTHTNARWGTFIAGDDIFVQGNVPYVGYVQDWYRIVNYTFEPYAKVATFNLEPSDSFTYGATAFDQFADLPQEGFAVLSDADFGDGDGEIDQDQQEQINIKLCQQQGVEAFNKKNIANGMAYAYRKIDGGISYALLLMPLDQVIEPFYLVIGRTPQGYLITGSNVYLIAANGSVGQAPETTNTTPSPTYTDSGGTITLNAPFDPALRLAAREYANAFTANIRINSDLSFMGISANAEKWRSTIGYMFYTLLHGQYNYGINSPGGQFIGLVNNIAANYTTLV